MSAILTLNAGSSSLKFSVYLQNRSLEEVASGQVENLGQSAKITFKFGSSKTVLDIGPTNHDRAVREILGVLEPLLESSGKLGHTITGVGHRVVHGGTEFNAPVVLNDAIIKKLTDLTPLAPLHQPHNLAAIQAARLAFPDAVQVACFDTAFHRGHPWVNDVFAIPHRFYQEGVRRYGFHGLSYDYITSAVNEDFPELTNAKIIIAHLGNGASMCAVKNGKSVGSTMGFSALDGLPMGTRCGQLDPGVILYLMGKGLNQAEISNLLYKESGLKGLSGISSDMRTLLASDASQAKQAIDYYVFRIRREIGALTATLGGLDAIVFCGGIGENSPIIRSAVLEGLEYLNLHIDTKANENNETELGGKGTRVLLIPTDEEVVIAKSVVENI